VCEQEVVEEAGWRWHGRGTSLGAALKEASWEDKNERTERT
jgi:hypothetical protein